MIQWHAVCGVSLQYYISQALLLRNTEEHCRASLDTIRYVVGDIVHVCLIS